jgi:ABC-type glycerol-3-phosphate transport system permease component
MYELMKRINDFPYPSSNAGCFPSYPTLTAVGIIVAAVPLIIIYPFFQKWFVTGLTVGGIKE